ncbi:MAG: 4-alpha-glucanotransferase [Dysgonamonadaceae bacterium]|jgi:4-alpha-glucanotransferase|nr:4-alpha-glucanotransferase [Dysgonamonadaceae bacterium]
MKISFNIHYRTVWGQTLHLTGSIPALGSRNPEQALNLHYVNDGLWSASIEIPDDTQQIEYRYFLQSNGIRIFEEWERPHRAALDRASSILLYDTWQNKPEQQAFYTSAFKDVLFARTDGCCKTGAPTPSEKRLHLPDGNIQKKIRLKVFAPRAGKDRHVAVSGNQAVLGNWNPGKSLKMSCPDFPEWEVEFDASGLSYPIEYKFILYSDNRTDIYWEPGGNRKLDIPLLKEEETAVVAGLAFRDDFPPWKGAGTVVPVFSLRSEESFGIGDFHDLKKLTDWVRKTGQQIIQILPVNDTTMTHTWMDSYPYNAISIYALHPLYLSLHQMGKLKDTALNRTLRQVQKELNRQEKVDYEQVDRYKWMFFRALFAQDGDKTLKSRKFRTFFKENADWLMPYAAYSCLRDRYKTSDFRQWQEDAVYDRQKIEELCRPGAKHYRDIALYFYLQYHLHLQLKAARDYARDNGVVLKGDIPIGVSDTSIEAWTEPRLFNMDARAGAPPDDFSVAGQNWGFPTYNWAEMEKTDYRWWKKRFRQMSRYFDAYRIDHILGFFRIWEVPASSIQALTGVFNPALPLTREEIAATGLHFDEEQWTKPRINGCFLSELFGVYAREVAEKYLVRISPQYFALHPDYDTQVKIEQRFFGKDDFKNKTVKNALFALANEVLFIADSREKSQYHPRISASNTFAYRELSRPDRYAFDYLYWDYFYRRHNDFWKEQACRKLAPLVFATEMLACGEDLGMIPQSVPEVMDKFQILSLEIERMPKQPFTTFEKLSTLPYRSICTTSTHDMPVVRAWWEENREKTQQYYSEVLGCTGDAPVRCTADICRQIVENHLNAPSMFAIIPLQDWMGIDDSVGSKNPAAERINIPSNPRHYWGYRMHLNIEDLLKKKEWNEIIRTLIGKAGR